jgi:farnesyl-diphosphate farnesyltransferase
MIPRVSRTFALAIRLLPPQVGYTVIVAYLLCRIADTIEDTADVSPAERSCLLSLLSESLASPDADVTPIIRAFAVGHTEDQRLVRNAKAVLREYWRLSTDDREVLRPSIQEMCRGMASFVISLAPKPGEVRMLSTMEELQRYVYYVAGTVGQLLTRLFILRSKTIPQERADRLRALSSRFAFGLQVTNIAQDQATDASRGVSFVPRELLGERVSVAGGEQPIGNALSTLVATALPALNDAIDYCTYLPRSQYRMRLFCLAPAYFAVRTLRAVQLQIESGHWSRKPKISRVAVYRTLLVTLLVAPSNVLIRAYFRLLAFGIQSHRHKPLLSGWQRFS